MARPCRGAGRGAMWAGLAAWASLRCAALAANNSEPTFQRVCAFARNKKIRRGKHCVLGVSALPGTLHAHLVLVHTRVPENERRKHADEQARTLATHETLFCENRKRTGMCVRAARAQCQDGHLCKNAKHVNDRPTAISIYQTARARETKSVVLCVTKLGDCCHHNVCNKPRCALRAQLA